MMCFHHRGGGLILNRIFSSFTLCFFLFNRFNRAFSYQPQAETSFRPDREIKRDRGPHLDY